MVKSSFIGLEARAAQLPPKGLLKGMEKVVFDELGSGVSKGHQI